MAEETDVKRSNLKFVTPLLHMGKTYENLKDVPPEVHLTKAVVRSLTTRPENEGLIKNPEASDREGAVDYAATPSKRRKQQ